MGSALDLSHWEYTSGISTLAMVCVHWCNCPARLLWRLRTIQLRETIEALVRRDFFFEQEVS